MSSLQDSQLTCLQPCLLPFQLQLGSYLLLQQCGQFWAGHLHNNCKIAGHKTRGCMWRVQQHYCQDICLLMLGKDKVKTGLWLLAYT